MLSTSLKHESRIFPPPGQPPQWIPTTGVMDDQGRPKIKYQDQEGIDLGADEDGKHHIEVAGKQLEVWNDEIEPLQQVGFHWQNYAKAFKMMNGSRASQTRLEDPTLTLNDLKGFWGNLRNTLFICFTTVIGTVLSSALVAYGFARVQFPFRDGLFLVVLATMMLPYQVTLIPLFALYSKLGWNGTFAPLIVPYFFGVPFYIFLLRQFFMGIPEDLSAAARIDGCSEIGIFTRIILPLSKPALATTALFMFLFQWGDFLNPLIYLQDDRQYTLAVALQQFQSQHESAWGPLMAMSTVITLPIIVLFFLTQRTFIQGITMSGLKG